MKRRDDRIIENSDRGSSLKKGFNKMAQPQDDKPIAILGVGHAGTAAVIQKFIEISKEPKGTPRVSVTLFDGLDETKPRGNTLYPVGNKKLDDIHPFETAKPPAGFPSFGEYVRENAADDPSLKGALRGTPTYKNVTDYLQYVLDLAIIEVGNKAVFDVDSRAITSAARNKLTFDDGDTLAVKEIVRATDPPHLGGAGPDTPKAPAASAQSSKPKSQSRSKHTKGM